jgi:hypothetical protein
MSYQSKNQQHAKVLADFCRRCGLQVSEEQLYKMEPKARCLWVKKRFDALGITPNYVFTTFGEDTMGYLEILLDPKTIDRWTIREKRMKG